MDEMVEIGAKAAFEADYNGCPWSMALDEDRAQYSMMMRAALDAIFPVMAQKMMGHSSPDTEIEDWGGLEVIGIGQASHLGRDNVASFFSRDLHITACDPAP